MGIIGTGATAIQCIPFLGKHAKDLYVFSAPLLRRSAGQPPNGSGMVCRAGARLAAERRENFAAVLAGQNFTVDLVADGWTDIARRIGFADESSQRCRQPRYGGDRPA